MSADTGGVRRSRKPVVLIFLFSAAPFVLATLIYLFWKPSPDATVGVYLNPTEALTAPGLLDPSGQPAPLEALRGKWLLLMTAPSACDSLCRQTLYRMRQVRLAQADKMDRIDRVWLQPGAPVPVAALPEAAEVHQRFDADLSLLRRLPPAPQDQAGAIYLIDPHGNLVMRYDASVDPVRMIRELTRLLKINNRLG